MKNKIIVKAVLLLFVTVSVVYLVVREAGRNSRRDSVRPVVSSYTGVGDTAASQEISSGPGEDIQDSAFVSETDEEGKVIAFYFHGNVRCVTCRKIEALAKEAFETGFADEIKDGRLEWRAVNVEDPVHEHYIEDFQLSTRSVVLERITGGENLELKRLDSVWELVHGDKEIFLAYIQDETREFFEAADK